MPFLKLIRFQNLVIVGITQFFLYHFTIRTRSTIGIDYFALDYPHLFLLISVTLIIAACGYIINDIVDIPIDKVNKARTIIVTQSVSVKHAWIYFWVLFILGVIISVYVAWHVSDLKLSFIFPLAVGLLVAYSYVFKKVALLGNIIVAIFCAIVAGIILFAERHVLLLSDNTSVSYITKVFTAYMVFAFLSTLYREIVKDIEDMEGDMQLGYQTLPAKMGVQRSKVVSIFFCGILIVLLALFMITFSFYNSIICYIILSGITVLLVYSIGLLQRANSPKKYHTVSTLIKITMALGILIIPFL